MAEWTEAEILEAYEERIAILQHDPSEDYFCNIDDPAHLLLWCEQQAYFGLRRLVGTSAVIPESIKKRARKFGPRNGGASSEINHP